MNLEWKWGFLALPRIEPAPVEYIWRLWLLDIDYLSGLIGGDRGIAYSGEGNTCIFILNPRLTCLIGATSFVFTIN